MIKFAYIERNIEYAIESINKWREKEVAEKMVRAYLASALDELRKAKPVEESGEVTCSTGDKTCPFLGCRKYGTDCFCTASIDHTSVFYGDDSYLVPCKDCAWESYAPTAMPSSRK